MMDHGFIDDDADPNGCGQLDGVHDGMIVVCGETREAHDG